jgi:TonB family protein
MIDCMQESDLQGYLEESGRTPLRRRVERHLFSCVDCRTAFHRVVTTHQHVNAWLAALETPADSAPVHTKEAWESLMCRIHQSPAARAEPLARLLAPAAPDIPWPASLYRNMRDLVRPEKLPPLEITSKPVAVKSIWTSDGRNWTPRSASAALHAAAFALLIGVFTNPQVQQRVARTAVLIDPDLRPYLAPAQPTAQGGGGGGGAREFAPASKGQAPRPAPRQFVPPMVSSSAPRLPITPTIIAPPDAVLPQNNLPNWGDPLGNLANLSNGQGTGGGMGSGKGGGIGSGTDSGFGAGEGGGLGGGIFRAGGGVSAPVVVYKVDPEYSEEARTAKYSGMVLLSVIVDAEGHARDIRVAKSLGMGLDEKAIEAVAKWKFRPGMIGGKPVNVRAMIEVNFRLL